jgi:hypothetical protein
MGDLAKHFFATVHFRTLAAISHSHFAISSGENARRFAYHFIQARGIWANSGFFKVGTAVAL